MIRELELNKKESSPKFSKTFDFLIKVIKETDEHIRDMQGSFKWPGIIAWRLGERYVEPYYRPYLVVHLCIKEKGKLHLEVVETDKGFDIEVELTHKDGFAVCGTMDPFRLACACLMIC